LRSLDTVPTNLPVARTDLIGRSDEVAALSALVRGEQLVTLTGVGGVGKTRLALGVAASIATEFPDGCWLVELAPVAGDDEVVNAVAASVRSPTTGPEALAAYLADRRVLVLLDNCEHVLDATARGEVAGGVFSQAIAFTTGARTGRPPPPAWSGRPTAGSDLPARRPRRARCDEPGASLSSGLRTGTGASRSSVGLPALIPDY
jgi:hypothetical protein